MDLLNGILTVLQPGTLIWIIVGVTIGTLVGALPGIGSTTSIAILLPITFGMEPLHGLLLLMGIYQGSMFGGRISAILLNVPGDSAAVVTTFEGYPMTKNGKAGYALTLSAISSFFGGIVGFIGLALLSPVLVKLALKFGPPEYFSLMLFALIVTGGVAEKKWFKPMLSMLAGLLIATIGTDTISGGPRLNYGIVELRDGISFVAIVIGLFGISEVLMRIKNYDQDKSSKIDNSAVGFRSLFTNTKEMFKSYPAMIRGSIIGFFVGVLPGAGATTATFLAYGAEKKISKHPESFGTGLDEGLSSPEAANNSAEAGSFVPLFSLGIPGSATSAVLLGALLMYGLQPGPMMFVNSGPIVWGAIASLLIANIVLLILNTAFVPLFTYIIQKIEPYLVPFITTLCIAGVYLYSNSMFAVGVMIFFGFVGYFMRKFDIPLTPFILAVVLGKMLEKSLRQSLIMSHNSIDIFFTSPISATLIILTILVLLSPLLNLFKKKIRN